MRKVPAPILDGLRAMGLLPPAARAEGEPLAGGVSSDIWYLRLPDGRELCVKRARRQRKAARERDPLQEARWLALAAEAVPGAAPALLGQDAATGTLAMAWLPKGTHPPWQMHLAEGKADAAFAAEVGRRIARIHGVAADTPSLAAHLEGAGILEVTRLRPGLEVAARADPALAAPLAACAARLAARRLTFVHGDLGPSHILAGPKGPVFIGAACAAWGDPAFDLASCLSHLLLACLSRPDAAACLAACFDALAAAYLAGVAWEAPAGLEGRAASLLPGLMLAGIAGAGQAAEPAEEDTKRRLWAIAAALLLQPPARLAEIRRAWAAELGLAPS